MNAKLQIVSYGLAKENCIITYDMVIEMIERFTYNGRAQKWMYTFTAVLNLKKYKKTYAFKNLSSEKKMKNGVSSKNLKKIIFTNLGTSNIWIGNPS